MIRGKLLRLRTRAVAIVLLALATVASVAVVPATIGVTSAASAAVWPEYSIDMSKFNAGRIITDELFFDGSAMTESGVQSFLNEKVPSCRSGYTCLRSYGTSTYSIGANPMCRPYSGGGWESAARIITKVAAACGISQKVILVTLQKEQALVTDTWPSARQYKYAMGADCPDSGDGCGATAGFFQQVYRGAYMLKRYTQPSGTGPGTSYNTDFAAMKRAYTTVSVRYGVSTSCGTKSVYISNQATHVLYVYTPYTPNAGALAAGWGTAYCGAYGNRNFFRYYFQWFGDPNGIPPRMQTPPDQSGDVPGAETVGQTLTVTPGSWTGNPAPSPSYQWYACPSAVTSVVASVPGGCSPITGQTAPRYQITSAVVGKYVAPAVTLRNQSGSAIRVTPTTAQVYQTPANTVAPSYATAAVTTQALTVRPGTWTGAPVPALSYQWSVCPTTDLVRSCSVIPGATTATVTPRAIDAGKFYVARVTGANRAKVTVASMPVLVTSKPTISAHPSVLTTPHIGSNLTVASTAWSAVPAPAVTYEFFTCSTRVTSPGATLPTGCLSVGPASASNVLTMSRALKGRFIVVKTTAVNSVGTTVDYSASSPTPVADDPLLPNITTAPLVGQIVEATPGTWTGALVQPAWQSTGPKYGGYPIVGLQELLRAAGYGTPITAKYDARTKADVLAFQRAKHVPVADGIVGPRTWQYLLATRVRATPSLAYQWMACTAAVSIKQTSTPVTCADISGATAQSFSPTVAQRGKFLVVKVSATQSSDLPAVRWSLSSSAVAG